MTDKQQNISIKIPVIFQIVVLFALATLTIWLSFFSDPNQAQAYRFPRLVSVVFALAILASGVFDLCRQKREHLHISTADIRRFIPGFIGIVIYVYVADSLGFYLSSALFMFVLLLHYNRSWVAMKRPKYGENRSHKPWLIDTITCLLFIMLMYLLFTQMLQVQTPPGIFVTWRF